ncbi:MULTISPECIES: hypothetical protein [Tsukamurella]|uniref:Type IV toxin-antitoxin system AbiEi family antitoxin domain-containing protein n=2 Tax=Tsukamurella TaxID=2060 RepID=A0A5C5S2K3_9ACTN|nr:MULTISPECIES: hypothetical protein [Tsukamurella]NMD56518.1 hypothetical protein [Tsukamurella columbiensis]TWS29142.1 hypothetical protein FK530_10045 [Tsukamurella conjunctivitidis]
MGELMTRELLLAQGWTRNGIRQAIRGKTLRMLWPTVYTDESVGEDWVEYERMVRAAGTVGGWGVISHQSAAVLWGLPVLRPDYSRVHTTIDDRHKGGLVSGKRHVHPRPLPSSDVVLLDGIRVTSLPRTAVDTAMAGDYEQALALIDAARLIPRVSRPATRPPVPLAELHRVVTDLGRRTGSETVLQALTDSVECSESVGESWSRARMIQWKLPTPQLQRTFQIRGRTYYVDFCWGRLVGEFDGEGKYRSDADRRSYEQRRDADFATIGITVCHWKWEDLIDRRRFYSILTTQMFNTGVIASIPRFPG